MVRGSSWDQASRTRSGYLENLRLTEDTILLVTSDLDHHFKTRNAELYNIPAIAPVHIPTAFTGPGFTGHVCCGDCQPDRCCTDPSRHLRVQFRRTCRAIHSCCLCWAGKKARGRRRLIESAERRRRSAEGRGASSGGIRFRPLTGVRFAQNDGVYTGRCISDLNAILMNSTNLVHSRGPGGGLPRMGKGGSAKAPYEGGGERKL